MNIPTRLQDIPPAEARFCLDIQHFIGESDGGLGVDLAGQTVVVGFSGGVDSTVLLTSLLLLSQRLACTVIAAHLDHGLREASADDAHHAKNFCERLGIPFRSTRIDVAAETGGGAVGVEEAARKARYAFLDECRKDAGAAYIALGHNLDDLAEDSLMRMIRGAGWPQMAGMRAVREDQHILRPLLLTPRAAIENFARALQIPWVEDASNADTAYTRNRMRHDILPRIIRENPNYLQSVAARWRLARMDAAFFDKTVSTALSQAKFEGETIFLPRAIIEDMHMALRLRLYKTVLESLGPGQPLAENLLRLDQLFERREGGRCIQFPGGKTASCSRRGILFSPRTL